MFSIDHGVFASSVHRRSNVYDNDKGTVINEEKNVEKPYRTLTYNDFLQSICNFFPL